ncbi:MAG TPA: BACON domain-containing carbohydrate-binding protein [Vicinamibacterales bacterium]|nr:BACON domain-containing carbohydrate-binding protein [Vicinamibacterales bacterium]
MTTTTFPASGGSASISVTTPNTCAWTATSSAAFLTVSQGASGTGNGNVQFAVAANTGAARTALLTITGTPITITQQGQ